MQNRKRDTDVQNRLLDSVGEGESGMFQENSIETCILSRVKQITSPGWMHDFFFLNFLENKYFAALFLPYGEENQLYVYIYLLPLAPPLHT